MTDKMSTAATLVREIAKVDTRAAALKSKRDALVSDLMDLGWESGKVQTTAGSFTVSAVTEYPEEAFAALVGPTKFARCTKRVLDRAKGRALYPSEWAAVKVTKGQKVSFG